LEVLTRRAALYLSLAGGNPQVFEPKPLWSKGGAHTYPPWGYRCRGVHWAQPEERETRGNGQTLISDPSEFQILI